MIKMDAEESQSLRMYSQAHSYTYVVGYRLADAIRAYADYLGERPCDIGSDGWEEVPGNHVIRVQVERPFACGYDVVKKTAAEWIASNGRGFLCSAEF